MPATSRRVATRRPVVAGSGTGGDGIVVAGEEKGGEVGIGRGQLRHEIASEGEGGGGSPSRRDPVVVFLGIETEILQFPEEPGAESPVGRGAQGMGLPVRQKTLEAVEGPFRGKDAHRSLGRDHRRRLIAQGDEKAGGCQQGRHHHRGNPCEGGAA